MGILKSVVIGLVVLVVVIVLVGFALPSSAHVERSVVIDAPRSTVYALLSGFGRFNEWSPWAETDPDAVYTYEGPDHGVGAELAWASDHPNVGHGRQKITTVEHPERIEVLLDFGDQGTANSFYDLEPADGGGTRVTWGFDTELGYNPISRYMGLFFDKWIGADYEKGLDSLKALAESLPAADFSDLDVVVTEVEPVPIAYTSTSSSTEPAAIGAAHAEAYGRVSAYMQRNDLEPGGQPLTINTSWDEETYGFDAAIPLASEPAGDVPEDESCRLGETHGGKVLKVVHTGPYEGLTETMAKVEAYMAAHGLEHAGRSWNEWVSDPGDTPPEELITRVYVPVG